LTLKKLKKYNQHYFLNMEIKFL